MFSFLKGGGGGHKSYNFLSPYPADATQQFGSDWFFEKMLLHERRRRMTDTNRLQ